MRYSVGASDWGLQEITLLFAVKTIRNRSTWTEGQICFAATASVPFEAWKFWYLQPHRIDGRVRCYHSLSQLTSWLTNYLDVKYFDSYRLVFKTFWKVSILANMEFWECHTSYFKSSIFIFLSAFARPSSLFSLQFSLLFCLLFISKTVTWIIGAWKWISLMSHSGIWSTDSMRSEQICESEEPLWDQRGSAVKKSTLHSGSLYSPQAMLLEMEESSAGTIRGTVRHSRQRNTPGLPFDVWWCEVLLMFHLEGTMRISGGAWGLIEPRNQSSDAHPMLPQRRFSKGKTFKEMVWAGDQAIKRACDVSDGRKNSVYDKVHCWADGRWGVLMSGLRYLIMAFWLPPGSPLLVFQEGPLRASLPKLLRVTLPLI